MKSDQIKLTTVILLIKPFSPQNCLFNPFVVRTFVTFPVANGNGFALVIVFFLCSRSLAVS